MFTGASTTAPVVTKLEIKDVLAVDDAEQNVNVDVLPFNGEVELYIGPPVQIEL